MSSPRPRPFRRSALALALVATVALAGCAAPAGGGGGDAAPSGDPVSGGTLRFAILDAPNNLDPHSGGSYPESIITSNTADKLLYQDPETGELEPWLATSWEHNDDLTAFTFTLRDDVTFSDGTPFTAESVKENFDLLAHGDEELGILPVTAYWSDYDSTEIVDDNTVIVHLTAPNAGFPQALSHYFSGIVGSSTLALSKEERALPENIVTTGPFTVTEHVYQEKTVLTRRDDYDWAPESAEHQGAAYLDEVDLLVIPEASVRSGALRSGQVDAILDVQPTDEASLDAEGYQIISQKIPGKNIALNFQLDSFPSNDIAVRRAVQLGWDRDAITQTVLTDSYAPATSIVSDKVPGYVDESDVLRFDPEEAERILDEAGWELGSDGIREKDGKKLSLDLLAINNLVINKPAFESIQQDLKRIGIELNLSVLPIADWSAERAKKETWNIIVFNTSRDDISVLEQNFSPLIQNASAISEDNAEYDRAVSVLSELSGTLDPEKRAAAAKDAQDLLLDELVLTSPVYSPAQVVAAADTVHGIRFEAQSRNLFYDTWLTGAGEDK